MRKRFCRIKEFCGARAEEHVREKRRASRQTGQNGGGACEGRTAGKQADGAERQRASEGKTAGKQAEQWRAGGTNEAERPHGGKQAAGEKCGAARRTGANDKVKSPLRPIFCTRMLF